MKKLFILGISLLSLKFPHNGYCAAAAAAASSAESVAEISVEEPYRIIGLEDEIKSLLAEHGITEDQSPYLLPSHFSEILQRAKYQRFISGFSDIPGVIAPHPRGFSSLSSFFPKNYVTALSQHLFPAAIPELFIPNTLGNDPISSLSPDKLGKLVKVIEQAKITYHPFKSIEWRQEIQHQIGDILKRTRASRAKDADRDEFIKYSTAKGIVTGIKLRLQGVDLENSDLPAKYYEALKSDKPHSNFIKIIAPGYFEGGYFEHGFLEAVEKQKNPYSISRKISFLKKIFRDILIGAIEEDISRGDKQPLVQDLLTVFFHKKFAGNRKAIEEFYAAYLGIERVEFPSLTSSKVFGYEEYKEFQRSGNTQTYTDLPADTRASIALFEREQGEYNPTSYSSITTTSGYRFPNCVEESLVNVLFFLMRKRSEGLISYDASVFSAESPARTFMDKWGVVGYRNGAAQARIDFSEVLSTAEGIAFKKSEKYEIRSGLISGLNALLYMLGVKRRLSFSDYTSELSEITKHFASVLPGGSTLLPDEDIMKSSVAKEFFGNIDVTNGAGEVLTWKLQQGHSFVKLQPMPHTSWVDDLLKSNLKIAAARRAIPLVTNATRFEQLSRHLALYDQGALYRSMNLQSPELVIAIIESISRNILEGRTEHLKFMTGLAKIIANIDDQQAYGKVYDSLVPVVLKEETDDADRIAIIKSFPYVLTGNPFYFRRCEVLEWACKNNRGDLFSLISTEKSEKYSLNLNKEVIENHTEFLAENIGEILGIQRVYISTLDDMEKDSIRTVAKALPNSIENLFLFGISDEVVQIIIDNMPEMKKLQNLLFNVERTTPIADRLALIKSILRKCPTVELDPGESFSMHETRDMEEVLGTEFGRPRPYSSSWEPYDDYAGGAAAAAAAGI
tara:strand:+ start:880 stop:3591 length:2712 start_codon:yes stop_codon:yes gene_type:complete